MAPRRAGLRWGCGVVVLVLLIVGAVGLYWARSNEYIDPLPFEDRCTVGGLSLSLEQAANVSVIVGIAVRRGLPDEAATVALATAYQESGLRNLDHGDRDSLGLFQQRPSKGWGSAEQIMDPHYSTETFYNALLEVPDWQLMSVNDAAQAVQRSGHPEAYAKHEQAAETLDDVFAGRRSGALECFDRSRTPGNAVTLAQSINQTLGRADTSTEENTLVVHADSPQEAWAVAYHAVANAGEHGVEAVATQNLRHTIGSRSWVRGAVTAENEVRITLR